MAKQDKFLNGLGGRRARKRWTLKEPRGGGHAGRPAAEQPVRQRVGRCAAGHVAACRGWRRMRTRWVPMRKVGLPEGGGVVSGVVDNNMILQPAYDASTHRGSVGSHSAVIAGN